MQHKEKSLFRQNLEAKLYIMFTDKTDIPVHEVIKILDSKRTQKDINNLEDTINSVFDSIIADHVL